jgi:hypothetical protein
MQRIACILSVGLLASSLAGCATTFTRIALHTGELTRSRLDRAVHCEVECTGDRVRAEVTLRFDNGCERRVDLVFPVFATFAHSLDCVVAYGDSVFLGGPVHAVSSGGEVEAQPHALTFEEARTATMVVIEGPGRRPTPLVRSINFQNFGQGYVSIHLPVGGGRSEASLRESRYGFVPLGRARVTERFETPLSLVGCALVPFLVVGAVAVDLVTAPIQLIALPVLLSR